MFTGTLLHEDNVTVLMENFDAGILECRLDSKLVKTTNGLFRLIGPIAEENLQNLFLQFFNHDDIPEGWESFIKLNCLAACSRQSTVDAEYSAIGKCYIYKINVFADQENDEKMEEVAIVNDMSQQLSNAAASKKLQKLSVCKKPNQFLRSQFHRKLTIACKLFNNQLKK